MAERPGPGPGHRHGGQRRAGPRSAGAGGGDGRRPDGPCRAADAAGRRRAARRPAFGSPSSTRSWSAWGRARSPDCGSGSSPPRCLATVSGVALHGVCSLDVLAAAVRRLRPGRGVRGRHRRPAPRGLLGRLRRGRHEAHGSGGRPTGRVPRRPTIGPAADLYPDQLLSVPGPRALDPGVMAVRGPGPSRRRPGAALPAPSRRRRARPAASRCCIRPLTDRDAATPGPAGATWTRSWPWSAPASPSRAVERAQLAGRAGRGTTAGC